MIKIKYTCPITVNSVTGGIVPVPSEYSSENKSKTPSSRPLLFLLFPDIFYY